MYVYSVYRSWYIIIVTCSGYSMVVKRAGGWKELGVCVERRVAEVVKGYRVGLPLPANYGV